MTQAYSENCMADSKGNYSLDLESFVRSISDVVGCVACEALQLRFCGFHFAVHISSGYKTQE